MLDQIAALQIAIEATERELAALQIEIDANNVEIEVVQVELAAAQADVDDQNSQLNQRLRMMYESGDQSMIEVLLGSEDIIDFLSNLEMVQIIHKADVALFEELERKLDEVEAKKAQLVELQNMLAANQQELQSKQSGQNARRNELAAAQAAAHIATEEAQEIMEDLERESRQIEQELKWRESEGTFGGGPLRWPVGGRLTSYFGYRDNPTGSGTQFHAGIDIAGFPSGTPIHAAAGGKVYMARWYGGYGNCVIIDHGSGIYTLYGHNSGLAVSEGQYVAVGQVIAYAGTTGDSTGVHCHFEVRKNGVPQDPLGYL